MLFAVCSDRGAPGSTTTALVLAAARGLPAVVVEPDPYGGDLALRLRPDGNRGHPLPPTPTVLGVAAGRSADRPQASPIGMRAERRDEPRHQDLWREGSHELNRTVRVVPGFLTAEQGTSLAWPVLTAALQAQTVPIFADLGRIHTGSPSMPLAAAADALITVCRGDMGSVTHLTERLEQLVTAIAERNGRPPLVLPVVVAERRHGARLAARVAEILSETAAAPALRGVGWLAWDPTAVQRLEEGGDPWAKPLQKSPLMQSAGEAMWLLGMATGLEHAEPEAGRRSKGSRKQPKATATQQRVDPPPPPPQQAQPPSAWVQRPPQSPPAAKSPPPTAGQRTTGQHTDDQPTNGRTPGVGGGPSGEELQRRWWTAPMGEES